MRRSHFPLWKQVRHSFLREFRNTTMRPRHTSTARSRSNHEVADIPFDSPLNRSNCLGDHTGKRYFPDPHIHMQSSCILAGMPLSASQANTRQMINFVLVYSCLKCRQITFHWISSGHRGFWMLPCRCPHHHMLDRNC
jgi:hypothetical protein